MSILRSAFNLSELTISVRAVGIEQVQAKLKTVQSTLQASMTAAQKTRYALVQERNELQRTIYAYERLQRTKRMVMAGGVAIGTGMAVGGFTAMIRSSMELETALTALQRTSGLAGGSWGELQAGVRQLAADMPVAAEMTIKTAEAAAQLGIEGASNITAFTKTIVMLSQSTGISADKLATDFAKMMNVFQISAQDSEKYASVLAKLSVVSTATADDILNMTRRIGGASKTMGLGAEQAMALAAATIDIGATAEVGGTAWTNFMMSMMSETEKWASAIGMAKDDLEGMFQADAAGAIEHIIASLSKMNPAQLVEAMAALDIDGARARNTMLSLSKAAEKVREHLKTAKEELASGDTLAKQFELTSGTAAAEWQKLGNMVKLFNDDLMKSKGIAKDFAWYLQEAVKFWKELLVGDPTQLADEPKNQVEWMKSRLAKLSDPWFLMNQPLEEIPHLMRERRRLREELPNEEARQKVADARNAKEAFAKNVLDVGAKGLGWAFKQIADRQAEEAARKAEEAARIKIGLEMGDQFTQDQGLGNAVLGEAFGLGPQMDAEAAALQRLADATNKAEEAMRNAVGELQGPGLGMNVDADRWNLAMQIGNQLAGQPAFQSRFQGVDQLWRDLQTGSLTGQKTPEELAEEQIEQMNKAIEIATKVEKHLVENGIIVPMVGP